MGGSHARSAAKLLVASAPGNCLALFLRKLKLLNHRTSLVVPHLAQDAHPDAVVAYNLLATSAYLAHLVNRLVRQLFQVVQSLGSRKEFSQDDGS